MKLPLKSRASSMLFYFALIILVVGGANYAVLVWSQSRIIEHEAIRVAEVVTSHALSSRSVFASEVTARIDPSFEAGSLPIPSQFLKFVARDVSESNQGSYRYTPLSKWNLEINQGLMDEFQLWAWQQLEAQDQAEPTDPIEWRPVWRYEEIDGVRTLRYMTADAASVQTCVTCHNAYEQRPDIMERRLAQGIEPGKQWQLYQLMGALEIQVPVDKIEQLASSQARMTLMLVLIASMGGMLLAGLIGWRDLKRERATAAYFEKQARFDPLTRLLNRLGMEISAEAAMRKADVMNSQLSVFFIDLDGFKPVNDTYGHRIGDELLKMIAKSLRQLVRESDIVARMGGDEFLIIMEEQPGSSRYIDTAAELLDALSQTFVIEKQTVSVSASIGISQFPAHGRTLRELIRKADHAMYQAKAQGRADYKIYSEET